MSVSHLWATLEVTNRQFPFMPTASSVSLPGSDGLLGSFLEQTGSQRLQERPSVRKGIQQVISQHPHPSGKILGYALDSFSRSPSWTESPVHSLGTCLSILISLSLGFFFFFSLSHFPSPLLLKSLPNDAFSDCGLSICFWGNPNKDKHQTQCLAP